MKHLVIICAILIALAPAAQAQGVKFGIQGNVTNLNVPNEDLTSVYGLGYGGGIHFDVNLGVISFRLSGDYLSVSPDMDKFRSSVAKILPQFASSLTIEGGRVEVYSGNLNLKFGLLPLPVISVYLTGGGGVARLGVSETVVKFNGQPLVNAPKVEAQTKATANAGAGADINLGGLALFAEVKIVWIMTEGKTSTQVPLATVGLTF